MPSIKEAKDNIIETIRNSLLILIFEAIGTLFLFLLYNTTLNLDMGCIMCYWVLVIFGAKISGSHYNPAITLASMFRRDVGSFSRYLGVAYILF